MGLINSSQLERWLGIESVQQVSDSMRGWYGPPIGIAGVPGNVLVHGDGNFSGKLRAGEHLSWSDRWESFCRRMHRRLHRAALRQLYQANAGFSSLTDLITKANQGRRQELPFDKVSTIGTTGQTGSLWRVGNLPVGGTAPGNAPGGTVFDNTVAGSLNFINPAVAAEQSYFINGVLVSSQAPNTLLLFDLLFGANKTMASTTTEAVTGTPNRYQSTTPGQSSYAAGNFLFVQVGGTALAATAHDWSVCQYSNQGGTTGQSFPLITGNSAAAVDRLDHPNNSWFAPLASGDSGVLALTQMQCDASVATGVIWFMLGHPIAWLPQPLANVLCVCEGVNTSLQMTRIFNSACLAMLELKGTSNAATYNGSITVVSG